MTPELQLTSILIGGYLLDLLLGDPRWLPHPIILFGNTIAWFEKHLNKGKARFWKGAFTGILLPTTVFSTFYYIENILISIHWGLFIGVSIIFLFYGLANKSLLQEGKEVLSTLEQKGLDAGRKRLSWIVGRDTSQLNKKQIYTAVFETLSENLSDGVIAPLFYYAIGGIPGIMTYKMINTLDSMIGYKNDRYKQFGHFSAIVDDIANFIPARITALLMAVVSLSFRAMRFIIRYGNKHASPNAGFPESALAGILNCRFGGPNVYHGKVVEKPYIGEHDRELSWADFTRVSYINHTSTFFLIVLILLITNL